MVMSSSSLGHLFLVVTTLALGPSNVCGACWQGDACWPVEDAFRQLGAKLSGEVVLHGDSKWGAAVLLKNKRLSIDPGAVVLADTAEDVVAAMAFAAAHKLALSVKSTGHCYSGNCVAPRTFHLDVGGLSHLQINKQAMLMSVGPGSNFKHMYAAAADAGVLVVGGMCPTVGPVGFGLGGGHGPLIRSLGLGVDNIVSIDMVTTDARRVNVSADSHPDLFWALRGGGGGAYGVVVGMQIRLHPAPRQMVSLSCSWPLIDRDVRVGEPILEKWTRDIMPGLPDKWTFFTVAMKSPLGPKAPGFNWLSMNGLLALEGLYNGEWSGAMLDSVAELVRLGKANGTQLHCGFANFSSFNEWHAQAWFADEGPIKFRTYMASSFAQPRFDSGAHAKLIVDKILALPKNAINMMFGVQLGGKVSHPEEGVNATSVSPEFRSAVMMQENDADWNFAWADAAQIGWAKSTGDAFFGIRGFAGAYLNEPDPSLLRGEYEARFWGGNFGNLQRVKRVWDGEGLFNCNQSVYN